METTLEHSVRGLAENAAITAIVSSTLEFHGRARLGQTLLLIGAASADDVAFVGVCHFLRDEMTDGAISAARPIGPDGLVQAATEMAIIARLGLVFDDACEPLVAEAAFGRAPIAFLVAVDDPDSMIPAARASGYTARRVGRVEGSVLSRPGRAPVGVETLLRMRSAAATRPWCSISQRPH